MAYVPPPLIDSLDNGNVGEESRENAPLLPVLGAPHSEDSAPLSLPTSSSSNRHDTHMHPQPQVSWFACHMHDSRYMACLIHPDDQQGHAPSVSTPLAAMTSSSELPNPSTFWFQHSHRIWLYICLVNSVAILVMVRGESVSLTASLTYRSQCIGMSSFRPSENHFCSSP